MKAIIKYNATRNVWVYFLYSSTGIIISKYDVKAIDNRKYILG